MLTGNYTVPMIQKIANEEWGFKTVQRKQKGGRPISRSGLHELFTNYFYNGELKEGKHDQMITADEYDRVQNILGKKESQDHKNTSSPTLVL